MKWFRHCHWCKSCHMTNNKCNVPTQPLLDLSRISDQYKFPLICTAHHMLFTMPQKHCSREREMLHTQEPMTCRRSTLCIHFQLYAFILLFHLIIKQIWHLYRSTRGMHAPGAMASTKLTDSYARWRQLFQVCTIQCQPMAIFVSYSWLIN